MSRRKYILASGITFAINLLLDRSTKLLATAFLREKESISYLFHTVILSYTENSGAFLSLGSNWNAAVKYSLLLILPILICLYGLYYCLFRETDMKRVIIIVSIAAGGLGNLIDRAFNDFRVIDFLNFGIGSIRTGILNVADLSVTFGAVLLLFSEFSRSKKEARE